MESETVKKELGTPINALQKPEMPYDEDLDVMSSDSSERDTMREFDDWGHNLWRWRIKDDLEAYVNGDFHSVGVGYVEIRGETELYAEKDGKCGFDSSISLLTKRPIGFLPVEALFMHSNVYIMPTSNVLFTSWLRFSPS